MESVLKLIIQAPVANLVVLVGLVCFGLAVLGKFEVSGFGFRLTRNERIFATAIGTMLLIVGLHLLKPFLDVASSPEVPGVLPSQPTHSSTESSTPNSELENPQPSGVDANNSSTPSSTSSPNTSSIPEVSPTVSSPNSSSNSPSPPSPSPINPRSSISSPEPTPMSDSRVWEGDWNTTLEQFGASNVLATLNVDLGDQVSNGVKATGTYSRADGEGKLIGLITNQENKLIFEGTYEFSPTNPNACGNCCSGAFLFELDYSSDASTFNGYWEKCDGSERRGWSGVRQA
ncbi:MAG: hypothetical protein HC840_17860 [Leptolyngbyaceae cyanobacterium RM2_2_4]|nr:hypothetical protein [Leptolyngbyaceae cyanobacterium SM1_4_3]NJO50999.1 hypothetical protein [Leptolyngbyaceae cyanobacterium RM2_2_4]